MVVRATVPTEGHECRHYCVWIEDIERFCKPLHDAAYSHLVGYEGNFLPEDARMGYEMRETSYPVDPNSRHRLAGLAAEIRPLCLVASCEKCSQLYFICQ